MRRIWAYLQRQKKTLLLTALMVTVTTGLNLLGPYLLGRAIDGYILRHDLAGLGRICLLMLTVHAVSAGLTWLQSFADSRYSLA